MKKIYAKPEFDLIRFQFGSMMDGDDDPDLPALQPSKAQSYGEAHGGGAD